MKFASLFGIAAILSSLGTFGVSTAQAQCGSAFGSTGFPAPAWFGYGASPYSLGQIPTPPYFAIHPPVYYSAPVPRTYGYSPYAYPGTTTTPEIASPPEIIENPHATKKLQPSSILPTTVVTAQVVENPYVRVELRGSLKSQLAASAPRGE